MLKDFFISGAVMFLMTFSGLALGLILGWSNGALGMAALVAASVGIVGEAIVRAMLHKPPATRSDDRRRHSRRVAHG